MESLIIDLSPKTEEFNPNAGNGRKVLRNVYFRVEVENYTDTFGYTKDQERVKKGHENTKKYFTEIVEILQGEGWKLLDEEYKKEHSGHCPQLKKGIQNLYCHPQSISGDIYAEEVTTLEAAFLTAKRSNITTQTTTEILLFALLERTNKNYTTKSTTNKLTTL